MNAWKEESALRIMEALSGVDEELLERCEKSEDAKKKTRLPGKRRLYRYVRRYGGLCAAGICLAVLVLSFWRIVQPKGAPQNMSMSDTAQVNRASAEAGVGGEEESVFASPEEALEKCEEMGEEAPGAADGLEEPVWLDIDMLAERRPDLNGETLQLSQNDGKEMASSGSEDKESVRGEAENVKEETAVIKETVGEEISWEDVYTAGGRLEKYVPVELPEGYAPLSAERSAETDMRNSLLLSWTNGEDVFWLRLTETELNPDTLQGTEETVLAAGEDWQNKIPDPGEDGSVQFALLYEDGVLAEYAGRLAEEELRKLFP